MRKPAANVIGISCLVVFLAGLAAEPAHGYTLVDWIRTWPAYAPGAAPAPAIPVVVPTTPAPAPSCGAPAPVYTTPAPACGSSPPSCGTALPTTTAPGCGTALPAAPAGAGVSYVQPVAPVVAPAPQVRYRTTWVRVPTTSYRPVVTYDPATGWPATAMQPCTTYTWQLRREPAAGGGIWTPLADLFAPLSAPPAQAVVSYPAVPVTAPVWPGVAAPAVTGAPAYPPTTTVAPGATSVPGLPAPPSLAPSAPSTSPAPLSPGWVPSAAPTQPAVPAMPAPPAGTGAPATPAPADQPPQLSPNEAQGLQSLQPIPETRSYAPANGDTSLLGPPALLDPPKTPATPQSAPANVTPVPDPDAGKNPVHAAPSLYDPDGRTAQLLPLSTRWPAALILWPQQRPAVADIPAVSASGSSHPAANSRPLDADGWQAIRP